MPDALHIAILEDADDDFDLAATLLTRAFPGSTCGRAVDEPSFRALLAEPQDVILVDNTLPTFDGLRAIGLARELAPEVPVLVVSGSTADRDAQRWLDVGAVDYLLKDRLTRLSAAVERAVTAARTVRDQRRIAAALEMAEERFRRLVERIPSATYISAMDPERPSIYVSPQVMRLTGFAPAEWASLPPLWSTQIHAEDRSRVVAEAERCRVAGQLFMQEYRFRRADGGEIWLHDEALPEQADDGALVFHGVIVDISERKRLEAERDALYSENVRLIRKLLRSQEDERQKVALDLHDGPIQQITVAAMFLEHYLTTPAVASAPEAENLGTALEQMRLALADTRRIMSNIRPPALQELGLGRALRGHLASETQRTGVDIRCEGDVSAGALSPEQELNLYRIAQEAVGNALQHSGTARIDVALRETPAAVELEVRDSGAGFDTAGAAAEAAARGRGVGLASMRERTEMMGGAIAIDSAPARGTLVRVRVPSGPAGRSRRTGG